MKSHQKKNLTRKISSNQDCEDSSSEESDNFEVTIEKEETEDLNIVLDENDFINSNKPKESEEYWVFYLAFILLLIPGVLLFVFM